MPLYDYLCDTCGGFSDFAPMNRSGMPAACPHCRRPAGRVIGAPALALMPSALRNAHARSEKSAHEPARTTTRGCGCHGHHTCGGGTPQGRGEYRPVKTGSGPSRPWMLGH